MLAITTNGKIYFIFIALSLFFTICDLINNANQNLEIASVLSIIGTAVLCFDSYKNKAKMISEKVDSSIAFIKSRFYKWQIILSILDFICSLIIILSAFFTIALIFRFTFALRLLVAINKFRTLIYAFLMTIFIIKCRKGGTNKMAKIFENIKNNPRTILFGIICAGVFGFAGYYFGELWVGSLIPFWSIIAISAVIGLLGFLLCCWIGWDSIKSIVFFTAKKTLTTENYDKLVGYANELTEVEAKEVEEAIEKEKFLAEAKAELLAKQEAEAVALAEQKRLKSLVEVSKTDTITN